MLKVSNNSFSSKTLKTLRDWHPFLENAAARIHDRLVAHGSLAVFDSGSLPQPEVLKDCAALPVYHLRSQLGGCKEVSRLREPMGNHGVHQGTQLKAALAAWRSVHQAERLPLLFWSFLGRLEDGQVGAPADIQLHFATFVLILHTMIDRPNRQVAHDVFGCRMVRVGDPEVEALVPEPARDG